MWKTVIFASRFKTQKVNIMLLHPNDNVGLALTKIKENCSLDNIIAQGNIPAGHKIALVEIQKGKQFGNIIKPLVLLLKPFTPEIRFIHTTLKCFLLKDPINLLSFRK